MPAFVISDAEKANLNLQACTCMHACTHIHTSLSGCNRVRAGGVLTNAEQLAL